MRIRRAWGRCLAPGAIIVLAAALVPAGASGLSVSVPNQPQLPTVTLPSPPAQAPQVPSVSSSNPQLPSSSAPLPSPVQSSHPASSPSPAASSPAPVVQQVTSALGTSPGTGSRSGSATASRGKQSTARSTSQSTVQRTPSTAAAPPARGNAQQLARERRSSQGLRAAVAPLSACLSRLPGTYRRILALRTGLGVPRVLSRAAVAAALGLPVVRIPLLEARALFTLRADARQDGCAAPPNQPALGAVAPSSLGAAMASWAKVLTPAAKPPAAALAAAPGSPAATAPAPSPAVPGQASIGNPGGGPAPPGTVQRARSSGSSGNHWIVPLLLALLVIGVATALGLRGFRRDAGVAAAGVPGEAPATGAAANGVAPAAAATNGAAANGVAPAAAATNGAAANGVAPAAAATNGAAVNGATVAAAGASTEGLHCPQCGASRLAFNKSQGLFRCRGCGAQGPLSEVVSQVDVPA